ncbi:MAG TPA: hypothetical protein H9754_13125 [Candidatus Anaerostipes avistercoris]|uniref:Uncharacterized protein n=1 Tax=Candidatus Anaerostipes avistercoris TaxID=2838462 RepID=A0A9D2PLI9_9FIRM|nr:hypothetical protein [uncultured Anaerostipes sp.]HJC51489.1 hypothetical protein [Candidatus Anaerostipes avistercoris]
MGGEIEKLEITEAILAGERALERLQNARERLGKAKNWSLIDLFGGGLFTDVMKHSRLKETKEYLEEAKEDLRNFRRELSDVQMFLNLNLEISDFLKVTDIFFDNPVSDYMVQSKISQAKEQLDETVCQVENLISDLKQLRDY